MEDTPRKISIVPAGETVQDSLPGDFFLVHRTKFFSKLIQFGQGRRYTKEEAYWNHAGIFTSSNGDIAEALMKGGVCRGNILKYKNQEYIVVHIEASDEDRQQINKFVDWAVGKKYGLLTDISLAIWSLFGGKFDVSIDGEMICSGLVARALERAGYIFDRDSTRETPADLARHFKVHKPS